MTNFMYEQNIANNSFCTQALQFKISLLSLMNVRYQRLNKNYHPIPSIHIHLIWRLGSGLVLSILSSLHSSSSFVIMIIINILIKQARSIFMDLVIDEEPEHHQHHHRPHHQARGIFMGLVLFNGAVMRNQNTINLFWDESKLQRYIDKWEYFLFHCVSWFTTA